MRRNPFSDPPSAMRHLLLALSILCLAPACTTTPTPPETAPGANFLARNAAAKGVVTTPSGLQYFVVRSGPSSGRQPGAGDTVTFDYEGRLLTGETFDSSYARGQPITGAVEDFEPGFTEALKLMRPGDEWIVWIPPELGYGSSATGSIPANSILRFKMELRDVVPAAPRG